MLKSLFTKWFSEHIKPVMSDISQLTSRVKALESASAKSEVMIKRDEVISELGKRAREIDDQKRSRKPSGPLIAKSDALKNLSDYEAGYTTAKGQANGRGVGSEVEYYERNNKTLLRKELRGTQQIDDFIARAKRDEVRLVRQVR